MLFHFPFFYKCSAIHESLNDHFSLPRIFLRISISTRQRDSSTLILFKRSTSSTTKKKKNQTPSLSLRLFPRINFETFRSHIQLSSSYKTARIHILAKEKKIKFILDLFLPKFHRFPPDYFYESISRDNPIPYPLFRVLWTHTHIHDFTDPMVRDPSICIKRGHTRSKEYSVERFRSRDAPVRG